MRRVFATLAIFALACSLIAAPKKKRKTVRRTPPRRELKVEPSTDIETRVQTEIRRADGIIAHLEAANLFDSPYLVSSVYYHAGFLSAYPEDKPDADPARRIISHVTRALTPALKSQYIALLHSIYAEALPAQARATLVTPVPINPASKRRLRRTHPYAIDMFAPEGTTVHAVTGGVVLLAENGWTEADPFSTSSHAGGNTVILFDPATDTLYRYCHMERVDAIAGAVLEAGHPIGIVGHTGLNASRNGHGRHLHLEVNRYADGAIHPLANKDIWALLKKAAPPA